MMVRLIKASRNDGPERQGGGTISIVYIGQTIRTPSSGALQSDFAAERELPPPPTESGFSQGFFLHSVTDGVLIPCRCRLWLA